MLVVYLDFHFRIMIIAILDFINDASKSNFYQRTTLKNCHFHLQAKFRFHFLYLF